MDNSPYLVYNVWCTKYDTVLYSKQTTVYSIPYMVISPFMVNHKWGSIYSKLWDDKRSTICSIPYMVHSPYDVDDIRRSKYCTGLFRKQCTR